MKIIFLDFDGVLHKENSTPAQYFSRAFLLEELLQTNPCKIVVSSSWQFSKEYPEMLKKMPAILFQSIKGTTQSSYNGDASRLKEINHYLEKNCLNDIDWIALDDRAENFPQNFSKLICCESSKGITKKQISILKQWLNH